MKKLILFLVFSLMLVGAVSAATVSYGTIGTGATATQIGSAVELYTPAGLVGSGYVRLDIPGGIALNAITSLSYTAKVTTPGTGGFAPEVVLNIDADNDASLEGTGINWMLSSYNPATLGYVNGGDRGDNFLSGDNWPASAGSADSSFVNRDALSGYNYWSANDGRSGFSLTLWTPFFTIVPGMLPIHDMDPTDNVYSIDFVVGTSGNFDNMRALFSSVELNGVTYFVVPPTEVWVDDDYDDTSCAVDGHVWQYDCFDSIQDGIDAVEGSTIYVAAGTYNGFKIEGKDNIIVQGSGNVEISTNPVIHTINANDYKIFIDVINSTNITIKGLTLDAHDIDGNYFRAIFYASSDGTIQNNTIQNIDSLGQQTRSGIYVNTSAGIKILDNVINETGKGGIIVYSASSVQIEGNTITTTDNSIAPNGIQIGYLLPSLYPPAIGITGTISNNKISGCSWEGYHGEGYDTGGAWTGSGILIMDTTADLEILNNDVYDCDVGIDVEAGDLTIIQNNNLYDDSYGIISWNENPNINYNRIENNDEYGIFRTTMGSGTGTLDAEYNYWGACDGPGLVGSGSGDNVSDNVDYEPWLGICILNKTNVTCKYETDNITLEADLIGIEIDSVWFSVNIDGVNYNRTATKGTGNSYYYIIPSTDLVGGTNITWNVYANDTHGNLYNNSWKTFYVRDKTKLSVDPATPDGLNNWYITEPEFTLIKDTSGGNVYYEWDSTGALLYTAPFGLENIPNAPPIESAGTLELNWWTEFGECGNESQQSQLFYIDLKNPVITDLTPANASVVINNLRPTISAYLDEVYQSNSGIDKNSVVMKLDSSVVSATVVDADDLDAIVSYIPTSDLSEEEHNITVSVTDNAGRNSELTWFFNITTTPVFTMIIHSPKEGNYDSKRIPFNISLSEDVEKIEYINWNDRRPRWRRLCRNCDEYGFSREKTKTLDEGENNISIKATDFFGQVKEENITLFVDSREPRITRTLPRRNAVVNGSEFYVKYTEDNLKEITLSYGTGTETITRTDCEAGRNKECFFRDVDLTAYDGQWIDYWFNVSDYLRSVESRVTRVKVDTTSPVLTVNIPKENETYGRRVPFNITVSEDVTLEYIDNSASRPRWRRLCSRCDEYGFSREKTKSFGKGIHNIEVRAIDKAGNTDEETRSFNVYY